MSISYGWRRFKTSIILNALDMDEYDALEGPDRVRVRMIIGAGVIDFREDSPMWVVIHDLFPDGTNTWTALKTASEHHYAPSSPP